MLNRQELKEKLPTGYQKVVANKAGVTQALVSKYLNNKTDSEKVEMAVLETLAEIS